MHFGRDRGWRLGLGGLGAARIFLGVFVRVWIGGTFLGLLMGGVGEEVKEEVEDDILGWFGGGMFIWA